MNKLILYSCFGVFGFVLVVSLDAMQPPAQRAKFETTVEREVNLDLTISPLQLFPANVWQEVFNYLSIKDHARVSCVCKDFNRIASATLMRMGKDSVKFCDIRKTMCEIIANYPSSVDELKSKNFATSDDFFVMVSSFYELIGGLVSWCDENSLNLKMFDDARQRIGNMLSSYDDFARETYPDLVTGPAAYIDCVVNAAMLYDQIFAVSNVLRQHCDVVLENGVYFEWLNNAIQANSLKIVQYFINELSDRGQKVEYFLNLRREDGFCAFDYALIINSAEDNEHRSDETLKLLIKNGARAAGILNDENFVLVREFYFGLLKELGLGD